MNTTKIYLDGAELDIKNDLGFGLTYTASDVRDPSKRATNYSKTITLIGSKNNNKVLGGLFDINSDFSFFNPNFRTECTVKVGSTTVIKGYLRLKSIDIVNDSFAEGDYVEYKCLISSEEVDFFTRIKNKLLSELDFSANDHVLSYDNIVTAWSHSSDSVYTYPILYKNDNNYDVKDFRPCMFEKAYLERIALEAGYAITGSLMDINTEEGRAFSKDILCNSGLAPSISASEIESRLFYADTITNGTNNGTIFQNPLATPWAGVSKPWSDIEFTNDSTGAGFDNSNAFAAGFATTHAWTVQKSGYYNLNSECDAYLRLITNAEWNLEQRAYYGNVIGRPFPEIKTSFTVEIGLFVNGVDVGLKQRSSEIEFPSTVSASVAIIRESITFSATSVRLLAGDSVNLRFRIIAPVYTDHGFMQYEQTDVDGVAKSVSYNIGISGCNFYNSITSTDVDDGDTMSLNSCIPKNIKQSDIITDIIKRYNAHITIDKDNDSLLRIETRDSYYSRGETLDWSDKKDYSQKDTITLLSELQNKSIELSYTESGDIYNENYTTSTNGDVYGMKKLMFANEFVKGTKKITSPFSTSPLVYSDSTNAMVLPSVDIREDNEKVMVLHYKGIIDCYNSSQWFFTHQDNGSTVVSAHTSYPYSGHLDHPSLPTLDINFGTVPYEYFSEKLIETDATLYNRYWKNYIEQIDEGKKVSMYFNLSEIDISYIKNNLNDKIFVRDAYYIINKVVDYNPIQKNLTKVELLKVKEITEFVNDFNAGGGEDVLDGADDFGGQVGISDPVDDGSGNDTGEDVLTDQDDGFGFADLIGLRDTNLLTVGGSYFASDYGISFTASSSNSLDLTGTKIVQVVRNSVYESLNTWHEDLVVGVGESVIWGGRVWDCTATGASSNEGFTDYTLNGGFYEISSDEANYELISLDVKFSEKDTQIEQASDNRGNVVKSTDQALIILSDWGDYRIHDNITKGIINNQASEISGNNAGVIKNNRVYAEITDNDITGDILNNTAVVGTTLNIYLNRNRGSITFNKCEESVFIHRNINNGDIGTAVEQLRTVNITDAVVNK